MFFEKIAKGVKKGYDTWKYELERSLPKGEKMKKLLA